MKDLKGILLQQSKNIDELIIIQQPFPIFEKF